MFDPVVQPDLLAARRQMAIFSAGLALPFILFQRAPRTAHH